MNQQTTNQQTPGERAGHERCLCREVLSQLRECLGISPAVEQHLANSRIEFLKAIRAVIDSRIDHLSATGRPSGTKINVE